MSKSRVSRLLTPFLVSFLFSFMLLIFGPSEIYFANVTEFEFIYGDFIFGLVLAVVVITVGLVAIMKFTSEKIYQCICSVIFGISVAGYLQVMFFNKNLDLLGVSPDGHVANFGQVIGNTVIWLAIIIAIILLAIYNKKVWKSLLTYMSAFLLCIQAVALVTLLLTATDDAYNRAEFGYFLSGEEQYQVSEKENIIVIVLDYFSNQYIKEIEEEEPESTNFLKDFTYYNNADCNYWGTFPSVAHFLTGCAVDTSKPTNEWMRDSWNSDKTNAFYALLKEKDYKTNIYTSSGAYMCGANDLGFLEDKIANVEKGTNQVTVDKIKLYKVMLKISAYRMLPEVLKPYCYTGMDEYTSIVSRFDSIEHQNYDFYEELLDKGLTADAESNYYIVQHLAGPHSFTTDEHGRYKENAKKRETIKGCFVIVEEYLNQLKELGVYDDSTIIITSDHGDIKESQVIFYMKKAGESHEEMPRTNAPISLRELMPTIAKVLGDNTGFYGKAVDEFEENELRERTVWVREFDESYPAVPHYTGGKNGTANVYYAYTYTGDYEKLKERYEEGPSEVIPMTDSFF